MRTSVLILLLSALIAVGCNKNADSKSQGTSGGGDGKSGSPTAGDSKSGTPTAGDSKSGTPVEFAGKTPIEFVGTKPQGKHVGGFQNVTVGLTPIKDDIVGCKLRVEIETDSLWSDNPKLTKHLKSPDFFDVKKYPKATFISSKIEPKKSGDATHEITGDLTLHGKTRTLTIPATAAVTPQGISIDSDFAINRQDFDISFGKGQINDQVKIRAALRVLKP